MSILKYPVLTGVSLEAVKNLLLTAGYSDLIFFQALIIKDEGDRRFFDWPRRLLWYGWKRTRAVHVGSELTAPSSTIVFRQIFSRSRRVLLRVLRYASLVKIMIIIKNSYKNFLKIEGNMNLKKQSGSLQDFYNKERKKEKNIKTVLPVRIKTIRTTKAEEKTPKIITI